MSGPPGLLGTLGTTYLLWRASRLARKERLPEALAILEHLLRIVGAGTTPRELSSKLSALQLASTVAARMGNVALARTMLGEGLALWAELKLEHPMVHGLAALQDWERWGRSYLVETER